MQAGRSYVSDGKSHLMDFQVNTTKVGTGASEVQLASPGKVTVTLKAAAYLPEQPDEALQKRPPDQKPYWDIERARIGNTREVPVEIVVNGKAVASQKIVADGKVHDLKFEVPVDRSSWIAARILPAAHTNPVFAIVGGKPIRASRRSAQWCLDSVNQCWTQKSPRISAGGDRRGPEGLRPRPGHLPEIDCRVRPRVTRKHSRMGFSAEGTCQGACNPATHLAAARQWRAQVWRLQRQRLRLGHVVYGVALQRAALRR